MALIGKLEKNDFTLTFEDTGEVSGEVSKADFYNVEIVIETPINKVVDIRTLTLFFNLASTPENDPIIRAMERVYKYSIPFDVKFACNYDGLNLKDKLTIGAVNFSGKSSIEIVNLSYDDGWGYCVFGPYKRRVK